jgi:hypothetical protein
LLRIPTLLSGLLLVLIRCRSCGRLLGIALLRLTLNKLTGWRSGYRRLTLPSSRLNLTWNGLLSITRLRSGLLAITLLRSCHWSLSITSRSLTITGLRLRSRLGYRCRATVF